MISRTSKLLEIYDLDASEPQAYIEYRSVLRTITFPKMAYPDNPEVASSYSFQIYARYARCRIFLL